MVWWTGGRLGELRPDFECWECAPMNPTDGKAKQNAETVNSSNAHPPAA